MAIEYASNILSTDPSSPDSRPAREAVVPEIRQSPVLGLSWNETPRAKLPGWRLTKKAFKNLRWFAPCFPSSRASSSEKVQLLPTVSHPLTNRQDWVRIGNAEKFRLTQY